MNVKALKDARRLANLAAEKAKTPEEKADAEQRAIAADLAVKRAKYPTYNVLVAATKQPHKTKPHRRVVRNPQTGRRMGRR